MGGRAHPGGENHRRDWGLSQPARRKGREGSEVGGESKARRSSLPAPRLKEILASARYGVSLLERTLLMGRRSISSSEDAAINVGGRSRVARRAEREKEMERGREAEKGRRGKEEAHTHGKGEGRGGWERKGKGMGKEGEKRGKKEERERERKKAKERKG